MPRRRPIFTAEEEQAQRRDALSSARMLALSMCLAAVMILAIVATLAWPLVRLWW